MSRNKIKAEEKIRIVKACTDDGMSVNAAAEQIDVHHSVVDDWVHLYLTEGVEAFLASKGNRQYDPILKEAAVKDYLSGRGGLREICKIYKIRNQIQLRTWIKVYNGHIIRSQTEQQNRNKCSMEDIPEWRRVRLSFLLVSIN